MTEDDVYSFLRQMFRSLFNRDDIQVTPELKAADVEGWDSFAQINIVIETEEHFGFQFTPSDLSSLQNVGDFVAIIMRKTSAA